jgi:hypothetical protein
MTAVYGALYLVSESHTLPKVFLQKSAQHSTCFGFLLIPLSFHKHIYFSRILNLSILDILDEVCVFTILVVKFQCSLES